MACSFQKRMTLEQTSTISAITSTSIMGENDCEASDDSAGVGVGEGGLVEGRLMTGGTALGGRTLVVTIK